MLTRRERSYANKLPFKLMQSCILASDSNKNDDAGKIEELILLVRRDQEAHNIRDTFDRTIIFVNSNKLNRYVTCALGQKKVGVSLFTTDMLEEDDPKAFEEEKSKWASGVGHVAVCTLEVASKHRLPYVEHTIFFEFPENDELFMRICDENLQNANRIRRNCRMAILFNQKSSNASKLIAFALMRNHEQNAPEWLQSWITKTFREELGDIAKTSHSSALKSGSGGDPKLKQRIPRKEEQSSMKPSKEPVFDKEEAVLDMDMENWFEDDPLVVDENASPYDYIYQWEERDVRPDDLSDNDSI